MSGPINKQTDKQRIQLQRPLLSPVDRRGQRANCKMYEGHGTCAILCTQMERSCISQEISQVLRRGIVSQSVTNCHIVKKQMFKKYKSYKSFIIYQGILYVSFKLGNTVYPEKLRVEVRKTHCFIFHFCS